MNQRNSGFSRRFGVSGFFAAAILLLVVPHDVAATTIESVRSVLTLRHVRVAFSGPVGPGAATNKANYAFTGGMSVQGATLVKSTMVELLTSAQVPGAQYTLQISGVTNVTGGSVTTSPVTFTAPPIDTVCQYDAGSTFTRPEGPVAPDTPAGGYWRHSVNAHPGLTSDPVTNDLQTGLNAWQIRDTNTTASSGGVVYFINPPQASKDVARTNGWRLSARIRYVNNFGSTAGDHFLQFGDSSLSQRHCLGLGINSSGKLFAWIMGGPTIALPALDPYAYHTYTVVWDPVVAGASYYVDDQLILADQPPQAISGVNGLSFGANNSSAAGQAHYNSVRFAVVGGLPPVVTQPPRPLTSAVGQNVTLTAEFTPFVGIYQWLSNGIPIPGATGPSYTTDRLTSDFEGVEYSCRVSYSGGSIETEPATLSLYPGPAFAAIHSNGMNLEVDYRGILDRATQLANTTAWTPVASNLTSALAAWPVTNDKPAQYFRARMDFDWDEVGYNAATGIKHGVLVFNGARVNYRRDGQSVLKVTFGEPVIVAAATNAQPWGYFQFPGIRGTRDNDYLVAGWSMAPDSVTSYGKGGSGTAISKDGGRTWNPPAGENIIGGGTLLPNGERISVRTPAALPTSELQLPTPLDTRGNYVLYRMSALPAALQGVYINRMVVGSSSWVAEHNVLNDPIAVRYSVSGLFPVVWWGDMKPMPDGSVITGIYPGFYLEENNQVRPSGVCFYRSPDQGHTWNVQGRIPYVFDAAVDPNGSKRTAFGFTEPAFEVLSNGTFLCVMRTSDEFGLSPMYRATSTNQGVTWTQPVAFTRSGVLPKLLQLANGVVVLASGRPGMQLRFSIDGNGGEWTDPFDMLPFEGIDGEVSCGYPSLLARGPDKFLLIYSDFKYVNDQGEIRKAIKVREVSVTRE